jgi:threonine/homoserine/homoserine lactone efflux protein
MLLLGLTLGLSAGLSPGPLMTLVITTTLRDGLWHGLRVAAAPFVTDLPIILLSVFVLGLLPPWTLAIIGIVGGAYVIYLGWETVRSARQASGQILQGAPEATATGRQTLLRGAAVNALNPHPYLFWAAVGGPTLLAAFSQSLLQGALFLLGFYVTLIGSKVAVAALVHSQSRRFSAVWYQRILVLLGLLLIGLGLWLGWQALQLAGF